MDLQERIYHLHRLLAGRRTPLPFADIVAALGCSESTTRRAIDRLRNGYEAPLVYDPAGRGWRLDRSGPHPFELPGLWFSDAELHALLTAHELMGTLPPGLLSSH